MMFKMMNPLGSGPSLPSMGEKEDSLSREERLQQEREKKEEMVRAEKERKSRYLKEREVRDGESRESGGCPSCGAPAPCSTWLKITLGFTAAKAVARS